MIQWRNAYNRYGAVSKFFHWLIALAVIGMLGLGLYMTAQELSPRLFTLYFWHKSIGMTILVLACARLVWLWISPRPPALASHKKWEKIMARIIHIFFYGALLAMPLTGWVMSSAKAFPVSVFGWFTLPDLVAESERTAQIAEQVHYYLALLLIAAITLHIAGALKHHIIDRDDTLRRMLPFARPGQTETEQERQETKNEA